MYKYSTVTMFNEHDKIELLNINSFRFIRDGKSQIFKGDKIEKYIIPIYQDLFEPVSLMYLFDSLLELNCEYIAYEAFKKEFFEIIRTLAEYGILLVADDYSKFAHLKDKRLALIGLNETTNNEISILSFISETETKDLHKSILINRIQGIKIYPMLEGYTIHDISINSKLMVSIFNEEQKEVRSEINKLAYQRNIPWLNYTISKNRLDSDAIIVPGYTSCYECSLWRGKESAHMIEEKNGKWGQEKHAGLNEAQRIKMAFIGLIGQDIINYVEDTSKIRTVNLMKKSLVIDSVYVNRMESVPIKNVKCPTCSCCGIL